MKIKIYKPISVTIVFTFLWQNLLWASPIITPFHFRSGMGSTLRPRAAKDREITPRPAAPDAVPQERNKNVPNSPSEIWPHDNILEKMASQLSKHLDDVLGGWRFIPLREDEIVLYREANFKEPRAISVDTTCLDEAQRLLSIEGEKSQRQQIETFGVAERLVTLLGCDNRYLRLSAYEAIAALDEHYHFGVMPSRSSKKPYERNNIAFDYPYLKETIENRRQLLCDNFSEAAHQRFSVEDFDWEHAELRYIGSGELKSAYRLTVPSRNGKINLDLCLKVVHVGESGGLNADEMQRIYRFSDRLKALGSKDVACILGRTECENPVTYTDARTGRVYKENVVVLTQEFVRKDQYWQILYKGADEKSAELYFYIWFITRNRDTRRGYCLADIREGNVILMEGGRVRLVDYDLVYEDVPLEDVKAQLKRGYPRLAKEAIEAAYDRVLNDIIVEEDAEGRLLGRLAISGDEGERGILETGFNLLTQQLARNHRHGRLRIAMNEFLLPFNQRVQDAARFTAVIGALREMPFCVEQPNPAFLKTACALAERFHDAGEFSQALEAVTRLLCATHDANFDMSHACEHSIPAAASASRTIEEFAAAMELGTTLTRKKIGCCAVFDNSLPLIIQRTASVDEAKKYFLAIQANDALAEALLTEPIALYGIPHYAHRSFIFEPAGTRLQYAVIAALRVSSNPDEFSTVLNWESEFIKAVRKAGYEEASITKDLHTLANLCGDKETFRLALQLEQKMLGWICRQRLVASWSETRCVGPRHYETRETTEYEILAQLPESFSTFVVRATGAHRDNFTSFINNITKPEAADFVGRLKELAESLSAVRYSRDMEGETEKEEKSYADLCELWKDIFTQWQDEFNMALDNQSLTEVELWAGSVLAETFKYEYGYEIRSITAANTLAGIDSPRVIPYLVKGLANRNARPIVIPALARFGKAAVEPAIAALRSEDEYTREGACEVLGQIADAEAVQPLVNVLKTDTSRWTDVCRAAAEALGKIDNPVARFYSGLANGKTDWIVKEAETWMPHLIGCLGSQNLESRARDVLLKIGEPAVEPLLGALGHSDSSVRWRAMYVLSEIDSPKLIAPFTAILREGKADKNICDHTAIALIRYLSDERVREAFLEVAQDKGRDGGGRGIVLRNLTKINDPRVADIYIGVLQGPDSAEMRDEAAERLGDIGGERIKGVLVPFLQDRDSSVRFAVALSLDKCGWKPETPDGVSRYLFAKQQFEELVKHDRAAALVLMTGALKDSNSYVRSDVAEALGEFIGQPAVPALSEALKDEDSSVRDAVAAALDKCGWKPQTHDEVTRHLFATRKFEELVKHDRAAALVLVRRALKDSDGDVRSAAAEALREFIDPLAVAALFEALKDKEGLVWDLCRESLGSLRHIGRNAPGDLRASIISGLDVVAQDPAIDQSICEEAMEIAEILRQAEPPTRTDGVQFRNCEKGGGSIFAAQKEALSAI